MATLRMPPRGPTFPRVLWFWCKVVLCLVLLDLLLFGTGWFWLLDPPPQTRGYDQTHAAYLLARSLGLPPGDRPVSIGVGSSVLRLLGPGRRISRRLERFGAGEFRNLAVDGAHVRDAAIMANAARDLDPWLVVYGVSFRDFTEPKQKGSLIQAFFTDSSVALDSVAPGSLDEWLARIARRHWLLYRNRRFVRSALTHLLGRMAAAVPRPALAAPPPRRRRRHPKPRFDPGFVTSPSYPAWQEWHRTRAWSDYEAYLQTREGLPRLYRERAAATFAPEDGPELTALEWMLRVQRERGARVLLVYFPENPVFRDPAAAAYFNPEHSDRVAALLERTAARYGAQFVDLRRALLPEDFVDLMHTNLAGRNRLARVLGLLIAREWRLARQAEATRGTTAP